MFICSMRFSKKLAVTGACLLVTVLAVAAVFLFAPGDSSLSENALTEEGKEGTIVGEVMTLTDRTACLKQYGWLVDRDSEVEKEVQIPQTFDQVYEAFNDLQLLQGMDLHPYKGRNVKSFTYEILNYPDQSQPVFAELLVYENRIIGGEVFSSAPNAWQHGLSYDPEASGASDVSA